MTRLAELNLLRMVTRKNSTTGKRARKWGLKRFLILIGVATILALAAPYLIERAVDSSLDYERIRLQTEAAVRSRTGLTFTSQGLRFRLLRGIVFNGVRLIESKSPQSSETANAPDSPDTARATLVRAENLILGFSLIDYARGLPPVHTIQMESGRVLPGDRKPLELWQLFERVLAATPAPAPASAPNQVAQREAEHQNYLASRLRFIAEDIQIQTARGTASTYGRARFYLEAVMPDPAIPDDVASFRLNVRMARPGTNAIDADETGGPLKSHGTFKPDGTGRMYFTFQETPVTTIAGLLENTPLAPVQLTPAVSVEATAGLRLRSGSVTGAGSFDLYPRRESGPIGVNFKGRYRKLEARVNFAGTRMIEIQDSEGQVEYNGGFELTGENSHFTATVRSEPADAPEQTDYRFEVIRRDIRPVASGQPAAEDRLSLKGHIQISDQTMFAGFRQGRVDCDLNFSRDPVARRRFAANSAPTLWKLTGAIHAQNLRYDFSADRAGGDALQIQSLEMKWPVKPTANEAAFNVRGAANFLGGTIALAGSGRLDPQSTPGGPVPLQLITDVTLAMKYTGADLKQWTGFVYDRYRGVRRSGYDPESRRAEDSGPLWQNKFFETDFYRTTIQNLRARIRLDLEQPKPAGTLPPALALVARAENGYIRVESENGTGAPDAPEFQFKYESNLQAFLPRQDLQVRLRVPNNRLNVEQFTAHATPPTLIDARYSMGGDGILSGDLMQRTYSRLEIQAEGVRLGRNRLLDIIRHEAGMPGEDIRLERIDLTRSTDGSESTLRIRATAPDLLTVEGTGENLAGIGGSLQLRFRYPGDPGADRNLRFRIGADGGYVPEL